MRAVAMTLRHELIGLGGVVERNWYLVKRYAWWEIAFFLWTAANTLTIVFIGKGVEAAGGDVDVNQLTTVLLIGAVIWSYLGIIFEILTETVAWERWEGTIEYTFMAPLSRPVHLIGMGVFAVFYGVVRAAIVFAVIAAFFGLDMPDANFASALVLLAIASVSFIGIGMMTAVLPLISPEKGTQLGFIAQGLMLVVSGVYYPVSVLPEWMQWLADDLARDVRAARDAGRDPRGRGRRRAVGRHLAAARDRRRLHPARPLGVPPRRAVREAPREAEARGMSALGSCARMPPRGAHPSGGRAFALAHDRESGRSYAHDVLDVRSSCPGTIANSSGSERPSRYSSIVRVIPSTQLPSPHSQTKSPCRSGR